jgi:hypothetical protein
MENDADTIWALELREEVDCYAFESGYYCDTREIFHELPFLGDGTVPTISANPVSESPFGEGSNVYRFRARPGESGADHLGLVKNPSVFRTIMSILSRSTTSFRMITSLPASDMEVEPSHYLRVIGTETITLTDSLGHSTVTISNTFVNSVPNINYHIVGDDAHLFIMPTSQTYTVTFSVAPNPIRIDFTTGTGLMGYTQQAIRYRDITFPLSTTAMISITPQVINVLHYDSNLDGTFDTPITPTVSISGTTADDLEAPTVTIDTAPTQDGKLVTITAEDDSGVSAIRYSLDGTTFPFYTEPIEVDPSQTPVLYVFADDNLANRTGLLEYELLSQQNVYLPLVVR